MKLCLTNGLGKRAVIECIDGFWSALKKDELKFFDGEQISEQDMIKFLLENNIKFEFLD